VGLLARQTINCERIPAAAGRGCSGESDRQLAGGGEDGGREGGGEEGRGILPRLFFIRALARARRFAPVFNITPAVANVLPSPPVPARPAGSPGGAFRTKAAGIAPRNEFTILIWRAALAIYYLRRVGGKNGHVRERERERDRGMSVRKEEGRTARNAGKRGGERRGGKELGIGEGSGAGNPRGRRDNSRGSKIYRIYMRAPR